MMVGVEWLIGAALLALAVGWGLALLVGRRSGTSQARIRELQNELEASRQELEDYREDVIAQFSETARKFKTLDDSYTALHRQLAESSSLLCGAAPGPLLEAPAPREEPELAAPDSPTAEEATETTETAETAETAEPAAKAAGAGEPQTEASHAAEEIIVTEPEAGAEGGTEPRKSAAGP